MPIHTIHTTTSYTLPPLQYLDAPREYLEKYMIFSRGVGLQGLGPCKRYAYAI